MTYQRGVWARAAEDPLTPYDFPNA
jgi:hypothetical protein